MSAQVAKGPAQRVTPLHRKHMESRAVLKDYDGWVMPESYGDTAGEQAGALQSCGLCDISNVTKIAISGRGVESFVRARLGSALRPGAVFPVEQSGKIDVLGGLSTRYLYSRARDELFVVADPTPPQVRSPIVDDDSLAPATDGVHDIDVSSTFAGLSLVGPRAPEVLSGLAQVDVSSDVLKDRMGIQCSLARVNALIVRLDQQNRGLLSYDVFVGADTATFVWDSIVTLNHDIGVVPIGMEARLRLISGARQEGG